MEFPRKFMRASLHLFSVLKDFDHDPDEEFEMVYNSTGMPSILLLKDYIDDVDEAIIQKDLDKFLGPKRKRDETAEEFGARRDRLAELDKIPIVIGTRDPDMLEYEKMTRAEKAISDLDRDMLLEMCKVASFFDIPHLNRVLGVGIYRICQQFIESETRNGRGSDRQLVVGLRNLLGIVNRYTPEEEEIVRREFVF